MRILRPVVLLGALVAAHPAVAATDLLRGPTAMLNAPLVPFRSAVGGARLALDDPVAETKRKVILVPALTAGGAIMGLVEAGVWLVGGLADTVTGGYFALAPEEATHLSVAPLTPLFAPDARSRR